MGARVAIVLGLLMLSAGFALLARTSSGDGYGSLGVAMVLMGAGSGCAGPAATGTLLAALPPDRAGVGSAVNDTVAQLGQALSVAVLGSVLSAAYAAHLPDTVPAAAGGSIGETLAVAGATDDPRLVQVARNAFVQALDLTAMVGVGVGLVAAATVAILLSGASSTTSEPRR